MEPADVVRDRSEVRGGRMSPQSLIPKANTVRTQFTKAVAGRVELLLDMAMTKTDERLRAHFDTALKSGEEPYPPPYFQARITVLTAADFASGNNPGAQGPFEKLQEGSPDAEKLTRALSKALNDAGFSAQIELDVDAKELVVVVTDPEFTRWARSNSVERGAQAHVQETIRKRIDRDQKERAAAVLGEIEGPLRAAMKSGLAAMKQWGDGASGTFDVPSVAA